MSQFALHSPLHCLKIRQRKLWGAENAGRESVTARRKSTPSCNVKSGIADKGNSRSRILKVKADLTFGAMKRMPTMKRCMVFYY